jgi:TldD protein
LNKTEAYSDAIPTKPKTMKKPTRRDFLKGAALAAGSLTIAPWLHNSLIYPAKAATRNYFENEFGIDDRICQKLLEIALSKGGDYADLYFEHTMSNWVMVEDGKVNRSYSNILLGVGIRTIKNDQVGYGYTEILTEESMISVAKTAASLVNEPPKTSIQKITPSKIPNYYPINDYTLSVALSEKIPLVQALNDQCFALSDRVIKVNAGFNDEVKRFLIVTSDGTKAEDTMPKNGIFTSVLAEKDGKQEQSFWNIGGRRDFSFYTEDVVDDCAGIAVSKAMELFEAVKPPAGEMPVVLGPGVTGILLHEAIGHGMEADFNRKNISTFSDMIGKKVARPFVTIIDDGMIEYQTGSINIDDEGIPVQKTVLVENGILTSYMHDRISAKHYNTEPTGNGRRQSFEHFPMPRMRNTYMMPGEATPEDVIKEAKNGIYVSNVSNGQVKIGEGDFAFYVSSGRIIENGKLGAPIKDVNIMGNGPKTLKNIILAANDLEFHLGSLGYCGKNGQSMPVSFGLPTCLVESMTVGGTEKKGGMS